ncbi:MAG: hypothetical protein JO147_08195 [Actinobacteria bacterium]|nr:hypothetical protein [Actinomycetota bacterium]
MATFCVLLSAACSARHPSGAASFVATAAIVNAACTVPDRPQGRSGGPLVSVGADPVAAVTYWLPALDSEDCQVVTSVVDRARANELASAIRQAPRSLTGKVSCPNDNEAAVVIYFTYDVRAAEEVIVNFEGCSSVTAHDRSFRLVTAGLRRDLAELAPAAWAAYT